MNRTVPSLLTRCRELLEREASGISSMEAHRLIADKYNPQIPFRYRLEMAINATHTEAMQYIVKKNSKGNT